MASRASSRRAFLKAVGGSVAGAAVLARAEALEAAVSETLDALTFRADDRRSIQHLRSEYLLSPDIVYLNHASIGTAPRAVIEAHAGYLRLCESHPSLYVWGAVWREVAEQVRGRAAALLRCVPDDLAITHNTTEGFNILAHGLPLGPGDEVLFTSVNHASASVPWDVLASDRGFSVRRVPFPVERAAELTAADVVNLHAEAISPRTRALVFPHVDNMIGLRHPFAEIVRAAKDRGVDYVLVDGAQSAGMIPLDLVGSGVDAYAMSPHKWLQSPKGLGLFFVSEAIRSELPRMWHKTAASGMNGTARDYEDYSTRAWPAVVALGDALDFQSAIGEEEKVRRYRALWGHVRDRVDADDRLVWRSPRNWPLGSMLMAVGRRGIGAPALASSLFESMGGVVRAFGGSLDALRISPNLVTEERELDAFLDAMAEHAG